MTYEDEANRFKPKGCTCHDDSGDCDWCRIYYGYDKPWIDEEGRTVGPQAETLEKGRIKNEATYRKHFR